MAIAAESGCQSFRNAYAGRCSCGATCVTLLSALSPEAFQPRSDSATCEFCARHDGVWISDPRGALIIPASNLTKVGQSGSKQVTFHFCQQCEELTYAVYSDGQSNVAVARLALFAAIVAKALKIEATNFRGEDITAARVRRLTAWTPIK